MVENLTIVVPFYQGHDTLYRLIDSLPPDIPVIIVDDMSDPPLQRLPWMRDNITVLRHTSKGYFAGAVNTGIRACTTDVLVLNQDVWFNHEYPPFDGNAWQKIIDENRKRYAFIGERIRGEHPAFGRLGYIHGTFAYMRRDALTDVGLLNDTAYPLWGNTAEWQWRAARRGFEVLPLPEIPGFEHARPPGVRYGSSIKELLRKEPEKEELLTRTPPLLSVIVPCYNYGRYVQDCINSLIGGRTSLGEMPGQTLQSFEVIIVNDASTDNSAEYIDAVASEAKGIRAYHLQRNVGTAKTLNFGIERAVGKYITFLSADDMREPESLEVLVRTCEANPHSFAYDDVWLFHTYRRIKKWKMEEYDFEQLLYKNQIHAGIVYPKKAWEEVGGYPGIMDNGREDWAFNVALGIHGWCGVHVQQYGYLYRREDQNRSLTNTSPEHRRMFLDKISSVFPKIYGGYRPMACCGKGGNSQKSPVARSLESVAAKSIVYSLNGGSARMAAATGSAGMVKIEYLGKQMTAVWDGPATNTRYRFGADKPIGWVDKRDVGERGHSGFLNLKDRHNNWLFRVKKEESVQVRPQPQPVTEAVVVQTVVGETKVEAVTGVEDAVSATVVAVPAATATGTLTATATATADFPDPKDLYPSDIKRLKLTKKQWDGLYRAELAGRNRKPLITWLEEKLASE